MQSIGARRAFLQIQFAAIKHIFGSESYVESKEINHRYESDFVIFAGDCSPGEAQEDSMTRPCGHVFGMVDCNESVLEFELGVAPYLLQAVW